MELTRRGFLAGAGVVVAAGAAGGLATPAAWADEEPTEGGEGAAAAETPAGPIAFCEGCPGGCTAVLEVEDGCIAAVRGDGANPVSEGKLCLRGQQMGSLYGNAPAPAAAEDAETSEDENAPTVEAAASYRLASPRVRRAGSEAWEDISWDMALGEIAALVKETRDATFEETVGEVPVMRTQALASFGGARFTAEEQYLLCKALRSWGMVNVDSEAALGRRAFAEGCASTFGIAEPDGSWADLANADVVVTVGSDHGASCPVSLRWIERARERGAAWIVIDPIRTRTAEMADLHVAIRPGTDLAFFCGLAKYLRDGGLWQPEYVLNYTNASYLLDPAFSFDAATGLFFGWDPVAGTYDKASWGYQSDGFETWNMRFDGEFSWVRGEGVPVWSIPSQPKVTRDITLQDPACAWVRWGEFLARYDLDTVAAVCGVGRDMLEQAYGAIGATAAAEKAAKILAGPGLTQHGTGAQAVRAAAAAQLVLGNIGVVGGGMAYMGGEPNEIMADAVGLSPETFCGGLPWPSEDTADLQGWLEAHTEPAGRGSTRPKALVSALREWWGEASVSEEDYGFDWLPKRPMTPPSLGDGLRSASLQGCFLWGCDAVARAVDGVGANELGTLSWLVVADGAPNMAAEFWMQAEDASQQQTTVYQLPLAEGPEKAGLRCGSDRVLQWADAAVTPFGESRAPAEVVCELWERVFNLYDTKGGTAIAPILNAKWDYASGGVPDLTRVAWALNGYVVEDSDLAGGAPLLIEGADGLRADGAVACAVAPLAGCWGNGEAVADVAVQPVGLRDGSDESGLALFGAWGFAWPGNVRLRGNRASANLAGQPWVRERPVLTWDGQTWVGADKPDFPVLREGRWIEPDNCAFPGLWEQVALFASDRMDDGPFPEHYEPLESPLNNRLNTAYASPVVMAAASRSAKSDTAVDDAVAEALAPDYAEVQADRQTYPIAAVVCGDGRSNADRARCEALAAVEPGCFVEMSPTLARIRGLATGDRARVFNGRASMTAPVLVTERLAPFLCEESEAHYVVLNGVAYGQEEDPACCWAALAPASASPVGGARDLKGFLVDIEKA